MDERKTEKAETVILIAFITITAILAITVTISDHIHEQDTTVVGQDITVVGRIFFDNPHSYTGVLDMGDNTAGYGINIVVYDKTTTEMITMATTDKQGQYRFTVPTGEYDLHIRKEPQIAYEYPNTNFFGPYGREIKAENQEKTIIVGPTILFCY